MTNETIQTVGNDYEVVAEDHRVWLPIGELERSSLVDKSAMELDWLRREVYPMCEFECDGYSVPRLLGQKDRVIISLALGFTALDSISTVALSFLALRSSGDPAVHAKFTLSSHFFQDFRGCTREECKNFNRLNYRSAV